MKTFILALFGLLALVNADPIDYYAGYPYAGYPYAYADPNAQAPVAAPVAAAPVAYKYEPASHENTKDKREANPEAWDLQEEDVYGEPRRAHSGAHPEPFGPYRRPGPPPKRYGDREKREEHRYPGYQIAAADNLDYDMDEAPKPYRYQYDNRRARRDVKFQPAAYPRGKQSHHIAPCAYGPHFC